MLTLQHLRLQGKRPDYLGLLSNYSETSKAFSVNASPQIRDLISFLLIFVILPALTAKAQTLSIVESESKLWIEGRSTIGEYACIARKVGGYALFDAKGNSGENPRAADHDSTSQVHVTIAVQSFDCGKEKMNEDMYEALKADNHPDIEYELIRAELTKTPDSLDTWFELKTIGKLTIAGKTNRIEMIVKGMKLENERFRVVGSKELSMSDYDVTPPTAFFGLIKADDRLVIHFDLVAKSEQDSVLLKQK